MNSSNKSNKDVFEAEVLESSVIDEGVLKKILLRAGRAIAQPALEGLELIMDNSTPPQVRVSIIGALTYLILPVDFHQEEPARIQDKNLVFASPLHLQFLYLNLIFQKIP